MSGGYFRPTTSYGAEAAATEVVAINARERDESERQQRPSYPHLQSQSGQCSERLLLAALVCVSFLSAFLLETNDSFWKQ
jgi:hypothetical protein